MSLEENKLDDLFREKLKNFAPEPPPDMWNRIGKEMNRKKAVRRMIIYRWMGVAALLLLALVTGILVTQNKPPSPVTDISKQISTKQEGSSENLSSKNKLAINRNKQTRVHPLKIVRIIPDTKVDSATSGENEKPERMNFLAVSSGMTTWHKPEDILIRYLKDYTIIVRMDEKTQTLINTPPNDQQLLAMESGGKSLKNKTTAEWKLGVQLAPAFSSHASGYSASYAQAMTPTGKSTQTGVGGGISVQVKTSRRWTIESGLYYSRSEDKSSKNGNLYAANADFSSFSGGNTKLYSSAVVFKDGQMIMNSAAGVIHFSQTPENIKLISGSQSAIGLNTVLISGDFSQVFDFMELPLTTRYRFLDGKVALELLSGLSANFVGGNQVILENGSTRDVIGKTADISRLGFSGIAGFGIIYPISKRISITVEPRASYWLTSLNNGSEVDFRPWRIGIYSGLTFGF
jgi:hypothetical protein